MSDDTAHPTHVLLAQASANRLVLGQIADKWSILILTVICIEPARFNALKRRLDGITHKALADALKRLERNGLVMRRVLTTSPLGVEYSMTPLGRSLQEPCMALTMWTATNSDAVVQAQRTYDALGQAIEQEARSSREETKERRDSRKADRLSQ